MHRRVIIGLLPLLYFISPAQDYEPAQAFSVSLPSQLGVAPRMESCFIQSVLRSESTGRHGDREPTKADASTRPPASFGVGGKLRCSMASSARGTIGRAFSHGSDGRNNVDPQTVLGICKYIDGWWSETEERAKRASAFVGS